MTNTKRCGNCKYCCCSEVAYECYDMCCRIKSNTPACSQKEKDEGCEKWEMKED